MSSELKTLIENQRNRRSQIMSRLAEITPTPPKTRKPESRKISGILVYALLGLTQIIGMFLIMWEAIIVSKPVQALPPPPTAMPTREPVRSIASMESEIPDPIRQVCTDVPGGYLHVRFTPGEGSAVRGYLAEGETVRPALTKSGKLDTQGHSDSSSWTRLRSPIEGWVNTRFICEYE